MKVTLSKFPNATNETVWQVLIPGMPLCKETDEVTASAIAREVLHQNKGNELYLWDYYKQTETLLDRS